MIEIEENPAPVIVDIAGGEIMTNIEAADNINVTVGENAQIEASMAVNYIESGKAEIDAAVLYGTSIFNANATAKTADFNANAANKQALVDEAAATAQYYAENVKFGMVPQYFAAADWVANDGMYQLSYQYDVVASVYKKNGSNYELMTNIDIIAGSGTVTIVSNAAFEGYVLLVNNAEKTEDKTFVFEQGVVSATWQITHNLNKYPSVTVVDTADNVIHPAVKYIDDNSCVVTFNAATKGKAYLN
jgi:hypothetical protein